MNSVSSAVREVSTEVSTRTSMNEARLLQRARLSHPLTYAHVYAQVATRMNEARLGHAQNGMAIFVLKFIFIFIPGSRVSRVSLFFYFNLFNSEVLLADVCECVEVREVVI